MDRNKVSQYLKDFQENEIPKTAERILKVPNTQKIISIIGPRRCGKTFYFFQIMNELLKTGIKKKQILYLNFEDVKLSEVKYTEIEDIIKLHWELYPASTGTNLYLFFDEPQNILYWEKAIRSIHDSKIGRMFVTGSSAKLLSKEIATSLRGRTISYTLLPFSFKEFMTFKGWPDKTRLLSSKQEATIKSILKEYLKIGGFPEVIETQDKNVRLRILREYFDLTTYRDIIERHKIKNIFVIKTMLNHLFSLFSKELSIHAFFNTLKSQGIKISKKTAYNYLNYIEDSLAVFLLRKFSYSIKTRELSLPKIFLTDTGLANLFVGFSENIGRIMENIVFLELKRKQNTNPLMEIYYWKSTTSTECDFVIKEGLKIRSLIQTCWTVDDKKTKEREIKGILSASKELKCNNLITITWDDEKIEKYENKKIQFIPLWKWLLETNQ